MDVVQIHLRLPDPSLKAATALRPPMDAVLMECLSRRVQGSLDVKMVLLLKQDCLQRPVLFQKKEEPVGTTQSSGLLTCLTEAASGSGMEDVEGMQTDTNPERNVREYVLLLMPRKPVLYPKSKAHVKAITLPFTSTPIQENVSTLVTEDALETRTDSIPLRPVNNSVSLNQLPMTLVINLPSQDPVEGLSKDGSLTNTVVDVSPLFTEDVKPTRTTLILNMNVKDPVHLLLRENSVSFQRQRVRVWDSILDGSMTTLMVHAKSSLTRDVKGIETDLWIKQVARTLAIKLE